MPAQVLKIIPARADFAKSDEQVGMNVRSTSSPTVRRPTRGIVLRNDTFATMRVVTGDGTNLKIIDAGGTNPDATIQVNGKTVRVSEVYSNFLLQSVVEDRQEKAQILETFGEPYIFFFGERPRILGIQGILLNSWDFNWEAEWWENYDRLLRGTKCVENDARVYLAFDNTIVGGYVLNSNVQKVAQERHWLQFQFNLFVTYYETFSNIGDPRAYQGLKSKNLAADLSLVEQRRNYQAGRPIVTLPPTSYSARVDPVTGRFTGITETEGLLAATRAQPSSLAASWARVQQVTRRVLSAASQTWAGEVVRVPQGFEGSFAYDETVFVRESSAVAKQVITFTTFDKNKDEYVGSSSHYGTSRLRETEGLLEQVDPNVLSIVMMSDADRVRDMLKEKGINPDDPLNNALFKVGKALKLVHAGVGVLNAARGVVALTSKGTGSAVKDFSGGLFNWGDIYGNLRRRSDDNTYSAE